MFKFIAITMLLLGAGRASAEGCPAFFRFVDFGLEARDGSIHRGGALFRAEGFDGQALLLLEKTQCLAVAEVSKDGRLNPIPVVTDIHYDPPKAGLDVIALGVRSVTDMQALADVNATPHTASLAASGAKVTRGPDFLCVDHPGQGRASCQLASPYPGKIALVVHCDAEMCDMPLLAIDGQLAISAQWTTSLTARPEELGREISQKIQAIHGFLTPLSSLVQP